MGKGAESSSITLGYYGAWWTQGEDSGILPLWREQEIVKIGG
jgi:hypothetical protein